MNSTLNIVNIHATSLASFKATLKALNPESDRLYVHTVPIDLEGKEFIFEGKTFVVTGSDVENNEEPLLSAILKGFESFDLDVEDDSKAVSGYKSTDEASNEFPSQFLSHNEYNFYNGRLVAANVPGLKNGELIGFYWIPLSGIMDHLQ